MNAVILLSGGLDSAVVLSLAKSQGYACYALNFNYGQRHVVEIQAAEKLANQVGVVEYREFKINLASFGGSALTDVSIPVPHESIAGIPLTYVPGRNTVFLSIALAWAEVLEANDIFIGVNAIDYSGYPDCRQSYIETFEAMANLATKRAIDGAKMKIRTPLIQLTKAEIIREGERLQVDFASTVSCYSADKAGGACGVCDACRFRAAGFKTANIPDPTHYI